MIYLENVSKRYGKKKVLNNISLHLTEPGIIALVGPNGVGKSTLLNALVNHIDIDDGKIRLAEYEHTDYRIFNHVSFLKDASILYPYMTGRDHLLYAAGLYGQTKNQINKVVNQLEIDYFMDQKVGTYSLGMKQLLLIALAILNDPKIIIMDEPLNGLDPSRIIFFRKLIQQLAAEDKLILMSSHTLSEIDKVCEHILFLHEGNILDVNLHTIKMSLENLYRSIYFNE